MPTPNPVARMRPPWPVLAALALALQPMPATAAQDVALGPPPPWVEELPLPDAAQAPESVRGGLHHLLIDHQIRVGHGPTAHYQRRVWRILSPSGVDNGSEVRIGFDPSFERLTLHHVQLIRDGHAVGTLRRSDLKIIQQETDLDQRIYNGSLTALVFLKDVRPGDVVDYAYTTEGENPILAGRFVTRLSLGYSNPVAHVRHLIHWPSDRTLHVKPHRWDHPPVVTASPDGQTYVWEARDLAPIVEDDTTPPWFDPYPWVQAGEFASWAEVARWARDLFETQRKSAAPGMKALVDRWRSKASDEARALEAVRFVQDEVRYLGIEIGPNSHRPHPPGQVLTQRFGDCKDKSLLLATLLDELGIEAHPALVNTGVRRGLDDWQPTPFAFDHVVVEARVGGKALWIDATRSGQGGRLASLDPLPFERALVLRPDTEALTPIPLAAEPEPTTIVEESYVVQDYAAPARLDVHTTYRRGDADGIRQDLATEAPADFAKRYLNFYAQDDPTVRALAPPRFTDDREGNVVVVSESYEIPGFWKGTRRDLYAWAVDDKLHKPQTQLRTMPLRVSHPVHVRHTQTVALPDALDIRPENAEVTDPAFRFRSKAAAAGKRITLTYTYESLKDWVAAPDVRKHLAAIDRVRDELGYRIDYSARLRADGGARGAAVATADDEWAAWLILGVAGTCGVAGLTWGVRRARAWRRKANFARKTQPRGGEVPASPLYALDARDLERVLLEQRCRCGSLAWDAVERESLLYDGRSMAVVTRRCAHCRFQQSLYFRFTAVQ